MDELLFKNEYIGDKETAKEIYKYWYFGRTISKITFCFLGIYLLMLGWLISVGYLPDIFDIILVIFLVSFLPLRYFMMVNGYVRRQKDICRGEGACSEISVSKDKIFPGKDENYYISFDSVKNGFETKNYIVLILAKSRMLVIFKKDSFTLGNFADFRAFLIEKGKKIYGKKTYK